MICRPPVATYVWSASSSPAGHGSCWHNLHSLCSPFVLCPQRIQPASPSSQQLRLQLQPRQHWQRKQTAASAPGSRRTSSAQLQLAPCRAPSLHSRSLAGSQRRLHCRLSLPGGHSHQGLVVGSWTFVAFSVCSQC